MKYYTLEDVRKELGNISRTREFTLRRRACVEYRLLNNKYVINSNELEKIKSVRKPIGRPPKELKNEL